MHAVRIGNLEAGARPLVVGTLTMRSSLPALGAVTPFTCDIVEVRLDLIGADTPDWIGKCRAIEAAGQPVLLTLRLAAEGGKWRGPDAGREPLLRSALSAVSCIDVELQSGIRQALVAQAETLGKTVVMSYHNFEKTPSLAELEDIMQRMGASQAVIPKISTMVTSDADVETLLALLRRHRDRPVCVIGMGESVAETRVLFPKSGSCLTYGYLDASAAPGQLSAAVLMQRLAG